MSEQRFLSTGAAAKMLCTTQRVIRLLIERRILPAVRITDRGHWRIPDAAVRAMIESREKIIAEWQQRPTGGATSMTPTEAVKELRKRLENSGDRLRSTMGSDPITSVAGLLALACVAYETQNDDLGDIFATAISQELRVHEFEIHMVGRVLSQVIVAGHHI